MHLDILKLIWTLTNKEELWLDNFGDYQNYKAVISQVKKGDPLEELIYLHFDELSADRIASIYDMRALNDKGGYNSYQKQETFIDEYGVKRYRITTLYENMDINKAYET